MNLQSRLSQQARFVLTLIMIGGLVSCGDSNTSQPELDTNASQTLGYTKINEPNADDPLDAQIYELDNGLKVYLTENHEEPRFYAEIAVRAGSKHDPADGTGLAHYLEHLLFRVIRTSALWIMRQKSPTSTKSLTFTKSISLRLMMREGQRFIAKSTEWPKSRRGMRSPTK